MTELIQPIPARLKNVAVGGHVAGADQIIDDELNKDQATINAEVQAAVGTGGSVDSRIAAAVNVEKARAEGAESTLTTNLGNEVTRATNAENALDSRVDTLEDAVGTGGSVDSRISSAVNAAKSEIKGNATSACDTLGEAEALISAETSARQAAISNVIGDAASDYNTLGKLEDKIQAEATRAQAAEADRYTKSETYTKTEVNGLVDTPHQEYVTVTDYASLPASGSKDTIYRISNYDGSQSQVADDVYSEYAWDGSQYVFLCVKSQIGEVFDISVYNNNAKYTDLAAALNGGANIPQSLQKGGMSIKFVQSSDNNYVQYLCKTQSFTTDITAWEKTNLEKEVKQLKIEVSNIFMQKAEKCGYYANLSTGAFSVASDAINGILFPVLPNKEYHIGFVSGYNSVQIYKGDPISGSSVALFIESVSIDAKGNFTTPNNAQYALVDVLKETFIEEGAYYISKDGQELLEDIVKASKDDGTPWFNTNVLNPNDNDVQVGIFGSNGALDPIHTYFYVSGYIPISPKTPKLVLSYNGAIRTYSCNNNYYDAEKNLIKTETQASSNNIATWFNGASYVRFSVLKDNQEQIEYGDTPTEYHPFSNFWFLTDKVKGAQKNINEKSLKISKLIFATKNLFNPDDPDIDLTGYLQTDGTMLITPYFGVSGYIPFTEEMENLICSQSGEVSASNAALCYYDSNKQFLKGERLVDINGIATWFEGVAYIRWSFVTYDQDYRLNQVEIGTVITDYVPYDDNYKIMNSVLSLRKEKSILGGDAFTAKAAELVSSTLSVTDAPIYLTKNDKLSLYAKISTFNRLYVGFGIADGGSYNRYLSIDGSSVTLLKSSSGVDSFSHGLTISTFIKVIISQNDQGGCHIVLQTLGGKVEHDFNNWGYMSLGTPFVHSNNCTLTEVLLSYTNNDLKKSVWVVGDSYTTFERWPQYLKEWGFWNFALFGLPGGNTDHMYPDIYKAFKKYMPKYLVWLVGMNDNGSNKTRDYKEVLKALNYLCNSVGSQLVVGITPTVPTISNEDKKTFILEQGYRYIDIYKAVGANSSGEWYSGYLSQDGVHPTDLGSQAIATQILTDFAEIMQY